MKIAIVSRRSGWAGRWTGPFWADNGPTNGTTGMRIQPQINTIGVKRVVTSTQLLHLFTIRERRQTNGTLAAHVFHVRIFLVVDAGDGLFIFGFRVGSIAGWGGGRPKRTLESEEESVNQGRDRDDGEKSEDEFERGEIDGAWWIGERRRLWLPEDDCCGCYRWICIIHWIERSGKAFRVLGFIDLNELGGVRYVYGVWLWDQ